MNLLARGAVVAVAYWLAGKLALLLAIPPGYATAVWPAAGIALVAVLLWGRGVAVGVVMGSFAVNVGTSLDTSSAVVFARSVAVPLAIGCGAALQALLGAALVRRCLRFPTALEEQGDVFRFTALAGPVACLVNATVGISVLLVIGAEGWASAPFAWLTWWVGDTIGVALVAPLLLLQLGPVPSSRRRRVVVGVPMLAGIVGVTLLFVLASTAEDRRRHDEFVRRAVPVTHALDAHLTAYEEIALLVGALFAASEEVTEAAFDGYAGPLLGRSPELVAISWNPIVLDADRDAFEAETRAGGRAGFEIVEHAADGSRLRAGGRARYVPIRFLEPAAGSGDGFGYDLASEPVRREALDRALVSGRPAATGMIRVAQDRDLPGFLMITPVARAGSPRGVAVVVVSIPAVVEAAMVDLDRRGISLELRDESAGDAVLFGGGAGAPTSAWWHATFQVGGRVWRATVGPTPAYLTASRSWQAWGALAAGLAFVSLLGTLTLVTTGRTSRVEREAARASEAEAKYRDLYERAPDLHASLDLDGTVLDCNQTLLDVLHLAKPEVLGRPVATLHDPACAGALDEALRALRRGQAAETNLTLRGSGGGGIAVSLRLAAVVDDRGTVSHGRAVWHDVRAQRQAERDQEVLLALTEAAGRAETIGELRLAVTRRLGEHLGVSRCVFHEIDLAADRAQVDQDFHRDVPSLSGSWYTLSAFSGLTQAELRAGRTVINTDAAVDARTADAYARGYEPLGIRSYIAVPLLREAAWRATLWVSHGRVHAWTVAEVALVHTVAEKAWLWLEHVRMRAELRALNEDLERRVDERTVALRDAVGEKEILLKEIHHRVKNNLQVISSLLSLQAQHVTDPAARIIFEDSKARVQAIALVHENLYRTRDLARIDFADYVQTLIGNLFHAHAAAERGVVARLELGDARFPVTVAIPCGLVISELVTNALKHAFPAGRSGTIEVSLQLEGQRARLTVADDGVGLPPGLDPRHTPSLGLELVYTFAEQLQAQIEVRRAPGVAFCLTFELDAP